MGTFRSARRLAPALALALAACGDDEAPAPDAGPALPDAGPPADAGADGGLARPAPTVVTTSEGPVRGRVEGSSLVFRGIPYAAPPVGDLRFRPPVPAQARSGMLDAFENAPICVQTTYPFDAVDGSEDCLALNVWAPAELPAEPLPVLFFIHGGDNIIGSTHEYDGRYLAERGGVVVVTVAYRLAAFGWLAHPAFAAENEHGSTGNYGLLDLVEALRWVNRNVAAFGGDPERILVFGQSAGASNTCALVASPLARGLFSRALMQSLNCFIVSPAGVASTNDAFVEGVGCRDAADVAACLRALPAEAIARGPGGSLSGSDVADFYEVVDGWALPEAPEAALRGGRHNAMPMVMGTTADEYSQIIDLIITWPVTSEVEYMEAVELIVGAELAPRVLGLYPLSAYGAPRRALVAIVSDYLMHCSTRRAARGALAGQEQPVFRYLYGHVSSDPRYAALGAAHGFEIAFVFHDLDDMRVTAAELAFSDLLVDTWTRFAATGDPNGPGLAPWPSYDATDPMLVLDTETAEERGYHAAECDFWDALE